jgi:hypothetical protein
VAIATGNPYVIDLDGPEGRVSWQALCDRHDPGHPWAASTGSGQHLYYSVEEELGNTVSKVGRGIDTRGLGGYVVAPPSKHETGRFYVWAFDDSRMLRPGPLPEWVAERVRTAKVIIPAPIPEHDLAEESTRYGLGALQGLVEEVENAPEGVRNDTLNYAAWRCGRLCTGGHLERSLAEPSLIRAGVRGGLPEVEVRRTVRSGFEAGLDQPVAVGSLPHIRLDHIELPHERI